MVKLIQRGSAQPKAAQQSEGMERTISVFLELERSARAAGSVESLFYVIVNDSKRLFAYRHAALLVGTPPDRLQITALSGIAVINRQAPIVEWLERLAARRARDSDTVAKTHTIEASQLDDNDKRDWAEFSAAHVLWVPLRLRDGTVVGVLWMARDAEWGKGHQILAEQLADAYAHAWEALVGHRRIGRRRSRTGWLLWPLGVAALIGVMSVPVPQAALAPAEVVARAPRTVAAPVDGVIQEILVDPNDEVAAGTVLARVDQTAFQAQRDVAARSLAVSEAELKRATQGAFTDREASAQVEQLRANVELKQAELAYTEALLERTVIRSDRAGIVLLSDPRDWFGRPVRTGERIMEIADPADVQLKIDVPVGQMITLETGEPVRLFLDIDPVTAIDAQVVRVGYAAEPASSGSMVYSVWAFFDEERMPPQVGLRGTAKIEGRTVPLALYLFGRPIATIRQTIGF